MARSMSFTAFADYCARLPEAAREALAAEAPELAQLLETALREQLQQAAGDNASLAERLQDGVRTLIDGDLIQVGCVAPEALRLELGAVGRPPQPFLQAAADACADALRERLSSLIQRLLVQGE